MPLETKTKPETLDFGRCKLHHSTEWRMGMEKDINATDNAQTWIIVDGASLEGYSTAIGFVGRGVEESSLTASGFEVHKFSTDIPSDCEGRCDISAVCTIAGGLQGKVDCEDMSASGDFVVNLCCGDQLEVELDISPKLAVSEAETTLQLQGTVSGSGASATPSVEHKFKKTSPNQDQESLNVIHRCSQGCDGDIRATSTLQLSSLASTWRHHTSYMKAKFEVKIELKVGFRCECEVKTQEHGSSPGDSGQTHQDKDARQQREEQRKILHELGRELRQQLDSLKAERAADPSLEVRTLLLDQLGVADKTVLTASQIPEFKDFSSRVVSDDVADALDAADEHTEEIVEFTAHVAFIERLITSLAEGFSFAPAAFERLISETRALLKPRGPAK